MSFDQFKIFLLLCFFSFTCYSKTHHFVIEGKPNKSELKKFIEDYGLTYHSHDTLGKNLYYFVTDLNTGQIKALIKSFKNTHWIKRVKLLPQFHIDKKFVISPRRKKSFNVNEPSTDENYANSVQLRAKEMRSIMNFNDPNSRDMWQLLNDLNENPGIDLNVYPVYLANITGKGVVGIVVDDALDMTHEDLQPNIEPDLTVDLINSTRNGARGTDKRMQNVDSHGTEVAGLFAAVANNSMCAFGVAYNAMLGGVRLLGTKVTDYMIGEAFSLFKEKSCIYIASWGPTDDGKAMRSPGKYMNQALRSTATKGNHGRGAVVVLPTGNGGYHGDNCGADGFINHPNVIGVSAVNENGLSPAYGESCSAVSVSVPVGGDEDRATFRNQLSSRKLFVPTTKINDLCTGRFVGTSASNPMAAGVIALALEANPNLTPRDVHAILALSGRIPSSKALDFGINGGGLLVSHTYGSGLLNALRMVKLARDWKSLGPQKQCALNYKPTKTFSKNCHFSNKSIQIRFNINRTDCDVEVLEMALVEMEWTTDNRGSTEVFLTSPSGQTAQLLAARPRDHFIGNVEFQWKSLLHTGERSYGTWIVEVQSNDQYYRPTHRSRDKSIKCVKFIGLKVVGTSKNSSAFELNKGHIVKDWDSKRKYAHLHNRALKLDARDIAKIYNEERWKVLQETMND